jgi:uridine kinase
LIEEKLSKEIIANRNAHGMTIVSICGAADLGKSYLSKKIAELLTKQNISTNHLTMDSYLISRDIKKKKGLSGYDIEAYNQKKVLKDLIDLKNGAAIDFRPYNHIEGKTSPNSYKMRASDILIFDGLHAMHGSLLPYIDMTVYVYTKDDLLMETRSEADLLKRKYTTDFSKSISESEFNLYKSNIEPYKESADYVLFLKERWDYKLECSL